MKKIVILIIIVVNSILNINITIAQVLEQDSLALVAFYNSTGGPDWDDNSNWLTGPVGTWYGVTVEGNRVKKIILNSNNLSGILPPELGELTDLVTIACSNDNGLTGEIPIELFQINSLKQIGIGNCSLTGTIPNVGNCSGLTELNLPQNNLTGPIPTEIGYLDSLKHLDLHNNQLTGPIPPELSNCANLSNIALNDNMLSGIIPPELAQLNNLSILYLQNNQLTGNIPESFSNFFIWETEEIGLSVSNNNLSGEIPESWASMNFSIAELDISQNNFTYLPSINYNWLITYFSVRSNNFTFEQLESHKQAYNGGVYWFFYYSPQSYLETEIDTALTPGSNYSIYSGTGGEFTNYRWYLNNQLILESPDADTLFLNNVNFSDTGIYTCTATNTLVTSLNLHRRPVHITLDTTVNVLEMNSARKSTKCYPNPADQYININIPCKGTKVKINLFEINGRSLYSKSQIPLNNSQIKVDLDGIPDGLYLIQILTCKKEYVSKIIINSRGADW